MFLPHVKICGLTRRSDVRFCAAAGAGALGAVFYAKSPRNVAPETARELFAGLPPEVARVGVFVNALAETMIAAARIAALDTVQMHGTETRADIESVQRAGFHVVKVLRSRDRWYGVTYHEDKPVVVAAIARMTKEGLYPADLWGE